MARIVDQALVLRTWDFSEASQTVALLTRDHGLVRGLAKGSKRTSPSAKFGGGFELLTRGEVVALQRPEAELASVIEWDLQEVFWGPRRALDCLHAGLYAADLAYHTVLPRDPHPGLFDALARLLAGLETLGATRRALLDFQWELLSEIGYRPTIEMAGADASGSERASAAGPGVWRFDPHRGTLSQGGGRGAPLGASEGWRVRDETVRVLMSLEAGMSQKDAEEATADGPARAPEASIERTGRLLSEYLRVLMDRDLPTRGLVYSRARGATGPAYGERGGHTDLSTNGS